MSPLPRRRSGPRPAAALLAYRRRRAVRARQLRRSDPRYLDVASWRGGSEDR